MQKWIVDLIHEYIIKNQICTNAERVTKLHNYFISQGFNTVALVCDALIADRKTLEILTDKL